jgi:hypothetical protein
VLQEVRRVRDWAVNWMLRLRSGVGFDERMGWSLDSVALRLTGLSRADRALWDLCFLIVVFESYLS